MKKLINDPRAVVREMLESAGDLNGELALLEADQVVVRRPRDGHTKGNVAIISGGGSGHEPAHVGYVGEGMLSAAVVGDVFTSPSVDAVLAAIRQVQTPAGVLLIVKNYTGDRLNFGLAAELARAEGIAVEMVLVADDVALKDTVPPDRRRGIAGTVLVHKLAGASAASGAPLAEVAAVARSAAADVRSMGVGLGPCIVPAAGRPGYELGHDEVELGLGIHGEKGVARIKAAPADRLVDEVLDRTLEGLSPADTSELVVLVNGLGGTPAMELSIVARRALSHIRDRGFGVPRAWIGNFMTALEMPGFSISVMPADAQRLALLDLPTDAPAWTRGFKPPAQRNVVSPRKTDAQPDSPHELTLFGQRMRRIVSAVADTLADAEPELTELDAKAGDGDLGASLSRGAAAIKALSDGDYRTPATLLQAMSLAVRRAIGGSSGPFYAIALTRAAVALRGIDEPNEADWRNALAAGIAAIAELGGAARGDRTMLDALIPALEAWDAAIPKGFADAASAATRSAVATADMRPRQGRASYLSSRAAGVPDGGAVAVAMWMGAIARTLADESGTQIRARSAG
jgi:dihydroxyacetone kinase